jgi:DNA repair exonuclease SbcCD nuclease subunit
VADAGVPVLLLPGNHERGRIPHPLLALHRNLHVLDRPRTVVLEAVGVRVAFTGLPYASEVRDRFAALLAEARAGAPTADVAVLCGHVHRHQVLRADGLPPVIYAGSTERTSRAEAGETKGVVLLRLDSEGLLRHEFRPLPEPAPRPQDALAAERPAGVYRWG